MEDIVLLAVGIVLAVFAVITMSGNISTVHSYNRKRVKDKDIPKYGMAVGIGTLVIGLGIIAGFVLTVLDLSNILPFVLIPAIAAGLGAILYAQFKYNKGIF